MWADESIETVNEKRDIYHNLDSIKTIRANDTDKFYGLSGYDFDEFLVSREEFVAKNQQTHSVHTVS